MSGGCHVKNARLKASHTTTQADAGCLFEPLLYSSINFPSIALVQHLWYRPDLARHVRHAEFSIGGDCDGDSHLVEDYNDEDFDSALTEILDGISNTEDEKFEYRMHL